MDRVIIISNNDLNGGSYAQITLGLNSEQFLILTSVEMTEKLLNSHPEGKFIVIVDHYTHAPVDGVKMMELIKPHSTLFFKDHKSYTDNLTRLDSELDFVTSLYSGVYHDQALKFGKDRLTSDLTEMGLVKDRGFEYIINRDRPSGVFYLIPRSEPMAVLINLLKGFRLNKNKPDLNWSHTVKHF